MINKPFKIQNFLLEIIKKNKNNSEIKKKFFRQMFLVLFSVSSVVEAKIIPLILTINHLYTNHCILY